ncbi:cytochrome c-554 [Roseibacterium elongatum DSM 19469]|uniref:Cytochrome c-554 n=1 Tax=Roseicyclus elongatus DSM 19469 TaxID=1294273 RepID=W8SRL1_9RHOB|nr:cytochrome c [Roseibacterium elongatum]AHM05175.1 cytochrome c-554 [Roseibacterium elongatum DSM 19469]
MTRFSKIAAASLASTLSLSAIAVAQDLPAPVDARQGQFSIMVLNLGVLGQMARGNTDYDAEAASTAAANLATISMLDQSLHWPEGTDNFGLDGTRALPAIWENPEDFAAKWADYGTAAEALAAVAGDGLEPMQAALGPLGNTCGACHDDYREPQ